MEHIKFTSLQITVAIVLSIIILTVAQILSFSISELPLNIGVTPAICNIFAGVLYCVFAFLGTKLLCQKLLKTSLLELKIPRFKVKAVWIISALTMQKCSKKWVQTFMLQEVPASSTVTI